MHWGAIEELRRVMEIPLIGDRKKALEEWETKYVAHGTIDVTFDHQTLLEMTADHQRAFRGARLATTADALLSSVAREPTLLKVQAIPSPKGTDAAELSVVLLRHRLPDPPKEQRKLILVPGGPG